MAPHPRIRQTATILAIVCVGALLAWPDKKKKKEEETQALQLPKELPSVVIGETRRLGFYVTPLSPKGLLSQQVREALKALERQASGDTILQIRGFVAGSGDLRRVRDLISETFTERRQPLPVVSIIQSGGLPVPGAQVVLEGMAAGKKDRHAGGLAWYSARVATAENPLTPVAALVEKSLSGLREAVKASGADPGGMLRVTCFLSSLDNLDATRQRAAADYPRAALNFVQTQREPAHAAAGCEGVAGLAGTAASRLRLDPVESPSAGQSDFAIVGTPRVVLTGAQVSFGFQEPDGKLAFERLRKVLEQTGVPTKDLAFVRLYPLSERIAEQVRHVRNGFFDGANPPAGSLVLFEGLSSSDAGFAVDVVAVKD